MNEVRFSQTSDELQIALLGRVDSNNAQQVQDQIVEFLAGKSHDALNIDMHELTYISSAGLRVLLRLRKDYDDLYITGVSPEVYEILDMTGFTQMMNVEKAYRTVSIEGCELIGKGANGNVYRLDDDDVIKVYNDPDALDEIRNEREVAKLALILGVPTAISYDVVRVGDSYGSVFELLHANSFSEILDNHPEKFDWCVHEYVSLLKKIHSTEVPEGKLPDIKKTAMEWAEFTREYLPKEAGDKLMKLFQDIPDENSMIHGDYHTKNIMLSGDEVLLIDMDTLAMGNPIFEFGAVFNDFVGFGETDHTTTRRFVGIDYETAGRFWRQALAEYLKTDDQAKIDEFADRGRIIGYTRLVRWAIRRGALEGNEEMKTKLDNWRGNLLELLERIDSLHQA